MKKIVLDPGHGGKDSGTVGASGVMEKDVVLAIAKQVRERLRACGLQVVLTREEDSFVELINRAKIANETLADYFISIHANSAEDARACGTETFAYAAGGEGERLASSVQNALAGLGRRNRGVKFANFSVLRNTKMPAILTEIAFLSNASEEELLNDPDFQANAAKSIAGGIIGYLGLEPIEETQTIDAHIEIVQNDYENSFAKADIAFGMDAGVFSLTDHFRPTEFATREELAAVVARTLQYLGR